MNYYTEIKEILINNEIAKKVKDYSKNKSDLESYYNVGKILSEAGKHYGEGIIKEYSRKLSNDINVRYDVSSLNKMKKFYILIQKVATLSPLLTYSHYVELLSLKNLNAINYYIKMSGIYNLSVRELRQKIKSKEYERLDDKTKQKLINQEETKVTDFVKNPIVINNSYDYKNILEKVLQRLILEDIPSFLLELGEGFTFIKNEYKIW